MPPAAPRILILRCGHTDSTVVARHGDYDAWFAAAMADSGCRFQVRHVPHEGPGSGNSCDGILVTGTAASVRDGAPWMAPLADFLGRREAAGAPILAVCFGAQLAAHALGGRVERNPRGWEIGSIQVDLTPAGRADALFSGLPETITVQSTHEDHAVELPADTVLLAGNARTPVQAFGWGRHLRAVQFHPEATPAIIRQLIDLRQAVLEADAQLQSRAGPDEAREQVRALAAGLRDSGHGRAILGNWIQAYVRGEDRS